MPPTTRHSRLGQKPSSIRLPRFPSTLQPCVSYLSLDKSTIIVNFSFQAYPTAGWRGRWLQSNRGAASDQAEPQHVPVAALPHRGDRPERQRGLLGGDLQHITSRRSASSVESAGSSWVGSTAASVVSASVVFSAGICSASASAAACCTPSSGIGDFMLPWRREWQGMERNKQCCVLQGERGLEEKDEEDMELPSQRFKRRRGEFPSGKGDVREQINSVSTLGNVQQKPSSVMMELVAPTAKIVSKPADSKVTAFVQESPVVKTEKFDGEMPRTMLPPSQGLLGRSAIQEDSFKSDYCKAGTGDKGLSSDGVQARGVSQPSKGISKINKTPMVESSAKCGNKEAGDEKCTSLPRLSEEPRITTDVVPFEPCNENNTCVQVKRETSLLPLTITSKWDNQGDMVNSLFNNVEVSMQALCALYRQQKLAVEDKRKQARANKLAEFLLDGDKYGPVKRTVEELEKQDVTNAQFVRQVAIECSEQLFGIVRKKEDPYFC